MLVCTEKEDGSVNMAPVSFFMDASFQPPMLAFAMGRAVCSGENLRRTGRAVLAAPGVSLEKAVIACGSASGRGTDKMKETPVPLQRLEEGVPFPEDSRVSFAVSLERTVEAGNHYLHLCRIARMAADESREALFAWDGYAAAPAARKETRYDSSLPQQPVIWFSNAPRPKRSPA